MSRDRAAEILWVLASPDVARMLCDVRGWSQTPHAAWLETMLTALSCRQGRTPTIRLAQGTIQVTGTLVVFPAAMVTEMAGERGSSCACPALLTVSMAGERPDT